MTGTRLKVAIASCVLACACCSRASASERHHNVRPSTPVPHDAAQTPVSFLNDVEHILTRAGCNQGACHGSQFGKGGFKLSLAGYDPQFDHDSIVRQAKGRRISAARPTESLLLRKSALRVAHAGGLKIAPNSADYRTLSRWIASGAAGPNTADPHISSLKATPERVVLNVNGTFAVTVAARYSDGSTRDVTEHTRINSLDESVATISPDGRGTARGRGATAIMLRFDGLAAISRIVVPYRSLGQRSESTAVRHSLVDRFVEQGWRELGLAPSVGCTDSEFIRRASLDIIGTLPSVDEVKEFESDRAADKDGRLIDRLLARPEYADYWALKWGDLLRNSRAALGEKGMWSFRNYIREQLQTNRPFDAMVRELITSQGGAFSTPASNYYRVTTAPQELAETTAQVFLGTRLQCARCHHHPFEKWSQNDYYGFAAFFARLGSKDVREPGSAAVEPTIRLLSQGEVTNPRTGVRMAASPLGYIEQTMAANGNPAPDESGDRRLLLADWLTSADNPLFARTVVNRYWGYFLGRGIVQPVDDMRVTNPPSNPELLNSLSADFTEHGFDLKRLIRTICNSRAYRLSSRTTSLNRSDTAYFSHFLKRRQPAEVLLDSINIATGTYDKYDGLPLGTRAIQLPDAAVASSFLDTFGRPPRSTSCECERGAEPSLGQSLQLLNGSEVNSKVADPNGTAARLIGLKYTDAQLVNALYYATLSRLPREPERVAARRSFAEATSRRQAAEDLLWALLNTQEFAGIQ